VPSGYESPRAPLLKKMCCGDSALIAKQPSARRRGSASTAPSGVGMRSPDDASTKGGLPEDHPRTLTSSIVLRREGSFTKRRKGLRLSEGVE
jgi:hypothetical protein